MFISTPLYLQWKATYDIKWSYWYYNFKMSYDLQMLTSVAAECFRSAKVWGNAAA